MSTPTDLSIRPRNVSFGDMNGDPRWWLGGDPIATALYNALSVTFPQGERFFMDSVRHYKKDVSGNLVSQVSAFITQEALHTREHVAFNTQVARHGYDVAGMEARTKRRLDFARTKPAVLQLGATIALEHFTAILAHALLADPRHLKGAAPEAQALWRWHAIEEIEHKSVAYDTFLVATRRMSGFGRWQLRVWTMVVATGLLFNVVGQNMSDLLRQDGIKGRKAAFGAMNLLWNKPGLLRQIFGQYMSYYAPGFHPWAHDDRKMIEQAERELAVAYPMGVAA
ncbi:MAG: metal-dependent hydrolase [Cypionkella sp.]